MIYGEVSYQKYSIIDRKLTKTGLGQLVLPDKIDNPIQEILHKAEEFSKSDNTPVYVFWYVGFDDKLRKLMDYSDLYESADGNMRYYYNRHYRVFLTVINAESIEEGRL